MSTTQTPELASYAWGDMPGRIHVVLIRQEVGF